MPSDLGHSCCLYAKILNRKQFTTMATYGKFEVTLLLICKDTK